VSVLTEGETGVLSVSSQALFSTGIWSVRMRVCAHAKTHTVRGVLGCESQCRDETPGGPEEFRRTKPRYICIRSICVQSTHV